MVGPHDIGGHKFGLINFNSKKKSSLDKRIDVLQRLVGWGGAKIYRVDELRFKIESLSKENYQKLSYYERWLFAIYNLLIDKDVLSEKEIEHKLKYLKNGDI